jgi:hypothetical protein
MDLDLLLAECIEMTQTLYEGRGRVTFDVARDGEKKFFEVWLALGDNQRSYSNRGGTPSEALAGLHGRLLSDCENRLKALAPWSKPR